MARITKVPNGPLIKKKGPYAGSTLKKGGVIKKAQDGFNKIKPGTKQKTPNYNVPESRFVITNDTTKVKPTRWVNNPMPPSKSKNEFPMPSEKLMDSVSKKSIQNVDTSKLMKKKAQNGDTLSVKKPMTYAEKRAAQEIVKERNRRLRDSILNRNAAARGMTRAEVQAQQEKDKKKPDAQLEGTRCIGKDDPGCAGSAGARERRVKREARRRNGGPIKKAQNGITKDDKGYTYTKQVTRPEGKRTYQGKSKDQATAMKIANFKIRNNPSDSLRTVKPVVKKNGGLIKRADGSYSQRGLWDNIRANKGSGKKPTKQMLVQEKKIKAKTKK